MLPRTSAALDPRDDYAVSVGRIKGAAFRELVTWYEDRFSPQALAHVVVRLPPKSRAQIDPSAAALGISPRQWYSKSLVHGLLDALVEEMPPAERPALAIEAGGWVMSRTLTGANRLLFELLATPERAARHAQRLWSAHYETGTSTVTRLAPNRYAQRSAGWAEHHPFICELHAGAARALYEAMGCRDAHVTRTGCVVEGRPACTSEIAWTP